MFVAYDADAVRNPQVQLHLNKLRGESSSGRTGSSRAEVGGDQGKGLDDT